MSLILASNSQIRRLMLEQAGINFEVRPPEFDEYAAKFHHALEGEALALRLAEGKASSIAAGADDWIIGSDSTVTLDGTSYSKPGDREEAANHLRAFAGRTMMVSSAGAPAHEGRAPRRPA